MLQKILVAVVGVALLGAPAFAVPFEHLIDEWEVLGVPVDAVPLVNGVPLCYSHNINSIVDLSTCEVTEAWLELDFTNDEGDSYGGVGPVQWDLREYAYASFDGSAWTFIDEVDDGQYTILLSADTLNDDGILNVELMVVNDLDMATAWLDHSRLYGECEPVIPEPLTASGLLLGSAGLLRYLRRRKK